MTALVNQMKKTNKEVDPSLCKRSQAFHVPSVECKNFTIKALICCFNMSLGHM